MSAGLKSFAIIAAFSLAVPVQAATPVTGKWVTQSKDGVVEIYGCRAGICGKIGKFKAYDRDRFNDSVISYI
jgi:uncharacterized protein (DUF2147 family)